MHGQSGMTDDLWECGDSWSRSLYTCMNVIDSDYTVEIPFKGLASYLWWEHGSYPLTWYDCIRLGQRGPDNRVPLHQWSQILINSIWLPPPPNKYGVLYLPDVKTLVSFPSGYQTALRLAGQGAHVIMACRNAMKAEQAISQIKRAIVCQLLVKLPLIM